MILTTNVENVANEEFGTDGGKNTQDKVFLMNEPEKYIMLFMLKKEKH